MMQKSDDVPCCLDMRARFVGYLPNEGVERVHRPVKSQPNIVVRAR